MPLDLSKVIREVRIMTERLSWPRFWAMWFIALMFGGGYLLGNVPWEKVL